MTSVSTGSVSRTFALDAATIALVAFFLATLSGCTRSDNSLMSSVSSIVKIGDHTYRFEGTHTTELTSDTDALTVYGVISDIHGETEKARAMGKLFKQRGVDAIIVLGDTPLNEPQRYHRSDGQRDEQEIYNAFSELA